jgi:hypothetical protein
MLHLPKNLRSSGVDCFFCLRHQSPVIVAPRFVAPPLSSIRFDCLTADWTVPLLSSLVRDVLCHAPPPPLPLHPPGALQRVAVCARPKLGACVGSTHREALHRFPDSICFERDREHQLNLFLTAQLGSVPDAARLGSVLEVAQLGSRRGSAPF